MRKICGIALAVLLILILPFSALAEDGEATGAPDGVVISAAQSDNSAYKELLMDSLERTVLGEQTSLKAQIRKILFSDEVEVTADNYNRIVLLVQNTIDTKRLSEGAALDRYTDEDLAIVAELIGGICDELGLGYSIDPSNDSQNEYARVVTITKNGKVLGRINSDAKTDVGERPPIGWIIAGGVLIGGAAVLGLILVLAVTKKKKAA